MKKNYGGNVVRKIDLTQYGRQNLASGPYNFFYYRAKAGELFTFSDLNSFSLVLLEKVSDAYLVDQSGEKIELSKYKAIQADNCPVTMIANQELAFLIGGVKEDCNNGKQSLILFSDDCLYEVKKPWGSEVWINGSNPIGYCLKKISINAGTKTSLQFHKVKQETNVLFKGEALLHYKINGSATNEDINPQIDIDHVKISSVTAIDVEANIIHRIESLTKILLYEISTPFVDDVIRISDDALRPSGRINAEHPNND